MKCKHIKMLLSPYLDDRVSKIERIQAEEHIRQCTACQEQLQQLLRLREILRNLPELEMPEEFQQDFRARLKQGE